MHWRRSLQLTLVVALAAMALGMLVPAAGASTAPTVAVTAPRTVVGSAGAVLVRVTLANPTAAPLRVLRWSTPADGLSEPLFDVTRDGLPVEYLGPLVKRAAPTPADYLQLDPGASVSYDVDLSASYSFAASGDYAVRYRTAASDLLAVGRAKVAGVLASNQVQVAVAGRPDPMTVQPVAAAIVSAVNPGCDAATQDPALAAALAAANNYANAAGRYFSAGRTGARYQTWFGAYNATRWQTVRQHYQSIATVTGGSSVRFTCGDSGCGVGTYAFVYPNAPYMVYVCDAFWAAPLTGTDSRAGTLIHEISHFTAVAGTLDYVYGPSGAQALAISNAGQATMNADNHEYFAENSPAQEVASLATTAGYDFGSQLVGTASAEQTFTITNSGAVLVTVGAVSATGDFVVTGGTCSGAGLAPAASCTVTAAFRPSTAGSLAGALSLSSDADASPTTVVLSGTGTASTPPPAAAVVNVPASVSAAPAPAVRVAARAQAASRLSVSVGSSSAEQWTFRIRVRRPNGTWAVVTTARGVPGGAVRIVDLPKGRYQVVVDAGNGLSGATSSTVTLRR